MVVVAALAAAGAGLGDAVRARTNQPAGAAQGPPGDEDFG
jgi:hypothetical protein